MTKSEIKVLEEAQDSIGAIRDKYQETFDSRSEAWQESEKADEMQELIDGLDDICTAIEDVLDL